MTVLGICLCFISALILYKRIILICFGTSAQGRITGYGPPVRGTHGIESRCYQVTYECDGRTYTARSLESASGPVHSAPDTNRNRIVTVYFRKSRPEVVTIKELKGTTILSSVFLLLGLAAFLM